MLLQESFTKALAVEVLCALCASVVMLSARGVLSNAVDA